MTHIFQPTDHHFFEGLSVPEKEWVDINGSVFEITDKIKELIDFANSNDLWEPCAHGQECWL